MFDEERFGAGQPHITIADVARQAGVSVSTVSRILNNKPDVAEETRQRILKVIEVLGYEPHTQAQNLAAGKSQTISLLFPVEHTDLTQLELDFFIGAAQAAGERDFAFNLMTTPASEANLFNLYRRSRVDGIILMQIQMDDWRVQFLQSRGYPFVMIGRCADTTGLNYIDLDFEGAVERAVDYLDELGHRHIALLTRPHEMLDQQLGPAVRVLAGYRAACQRYQIVPHYREVDLTVDAMYEATRALLNEQPQTTALITVNGATAAGVIRALHEAGRHIPDNFSVIALATSKVAQLSLPALTTIDFPTRQIGYQAAEILINQLSQPTADIQQILLPPRLIIRESTGVAN